MKKPKIGLLGLMLDGYEPIFPGIIQDQSNFAAQVADELQPYAEVTFDKMATNRKEIEDTVKKYNDMQLDGILIVLFAYSHSGWLLKAMQENKLPLAMAVLQPQEYMLPEYTEYNFTINQGIQGAQDNANILNRLNIPFQVYAGSRHSDRFYNFFANFAKAAMAYTFLKSMKVAVIGKMNNMSDIFVDEVALQQKFGCEVDYEYIGTVRKLMDEIPEEDVRERIEYETTVFDVDATMPTEVHGEAVRQYLALKKLMEDNQYEAITVHFETLGADGRFNRLHFLAASNLMADGYGYAAEGDLMCAALMRLAMFACNGMVHFSEMYAMDFKSESILMCHAGEGNWKTARKDRKPRLANKVFNEGGLQNPPTPLFTMEPGKATVVSFAYLGDGRYKFIVTYGEILDKCDLDGCELPYLFFKPECGFEHLAEEWLRQGGTHHKAVTFGDTRSFWKMLADMLGITYCEI